MNDLLTHISLGIRVTSAKLKMKRIPFFVQLAPTSICNLNCRYCFAQFHEREKAFFPYPELTKIIKGLAELGTSFIMITGGEPMMYPQIVSLIQLISRYNIECLLNTNGILVLNQIDDLEGVDIYSISLDGPRELNDYYRGGGVYDKVLEVVAEVRRRGKRVQLQFTMTKDLKNAFSHINEIAEEYGCFISINFLRPQKKITGKIVKPEEASEEEILEFIDWLIRERPRTVPYPIGLLKYVRRWPFDFSHDIILKKLDLRGFKPIPCAAGRFMIALEHKGDIYPCTKRFYTTPIGNCADGDIKKAWENLRPIQCTACLDLGCNLLNFNLQLTPATIWGLMRVLHSRRKARGKAGQ